MNENIHIPLMSWSKKVIEKIWAIFRSFHLPAKKVIRLFLVEQSYLTHSNISVTRSNNAQRKV